MDAVTASAGVKAFFEFVFAIGGPVCRVRSLCNTDAALCWSVCKRDHLGNHQMQLLFSFIPSDTRSPRPHIYIPATTVSQPASTTVTLTTSNTMPRKHKNAAEHEAAVAAITAHFSDTYISGNGRLAAYQQLCRDLDVDVGASIIQCKRVGFCNEYRGIDQRADHPTTTEHQRRPRQHPRFRPRAAARRRYQLLQVPELQCSAQGYHGQPRQEIPAKESKI